MYPKLTEMYADYRQKQMIEEWQKSLSFVDRGEKPDGDGTKTGYDGEDDNSIVIDKFKRYKILKDKEKKEEKAKEEYIKNHMEGILKIDKIDLELPILKGATKENLKISIASVEGTCGIGEIGNYSIAGHRSHAYGKNFNRLDEVEIGDIIKVDNGKREYNYTVFEKLYVSPKDVWVLYQNKKYKEITLITCHPMINPTQRLIVKGRVIQ
ncbi:class D sortase [Sporanaerobacter sp. PP17-6a]|uniref:class D sortase n=1 Tax=Sporanaerobacter sp. PP17-6a TaxID=1891289 RepID=UPI001F35829F|nr:class D sortase [Sporanaerobacter sp. PP17-6a]